MGGVESSTTATEVITSGAVPEFWNEAAKTFTSRESPSAAPRMGPLPQAPPEQATSGTLGNVVPWTATLTGVIATDGSNTLVPPMVIVAELRPGVAPAWNLTKNVALNPTTCPTGDGGTTSKCVDAV